VLPTAGLVGSDMGELAASGSGMVGWTALLELDRRRRRAAGWKRAAARGQPCAREGAETSQEWAEQSAVEVTSAVSGAIGRRQVSAGCGHCERGPRRRRPPGTCFADGSRAKGRNSRTGCGAGAVVRRVALRKPYNCRVPTALPSAKSRALGKNNFYRV